MVLPYLAKAERMLNIFLASVSKYLQKRRRRSKEGEEECFISCRDLCNRRAGRANLTLDIKRQMHWVHLLLKLHRWLKK